MDRGYPGGKLGPMGSIDVGRYGLWLLRALWFALPLVTGSTLGDTFNGLDRALVAEVPAWTLWFVGLVAAAIPSPVGLTVLRLLAPGLVAWPLLIGTLEGFESRHLVAAAYGALVVAVAFTSAIGDVMINGSAYGSERRMALRAPGFALLGPIQGIWLAMFASTTALWLCAVDGNWPVTVGLGLVAVGVSWAGWRILHQLARRWLVFVPAGFVIHDHLMAVDSILLRRTMVTAMGPASTDGLDEAADLSGRAPGLALGVSLSEPVPFSRRRRREVVNTEADRIVFTPSLPGAVLREARIRAIKVGSATG